MSSPFAEDWFGYTPLHPSKYPKTPIAIQKEAPNLISHKSEKLIDSIIMEDIRRLADKRIKEENTDCLKTKIMAEKEPIHILDPNTYNNKMGKEQLEYLLSLLKDITLPKYEITLEFSYISITENNKNEMLKYGCNITSFGSTGDWITIKWTPIQ
jgi:hypothetical protein